VYGENFGFGVGNSFGFLDPAGVPHFQASFAYWTDLVNENPSGSPLLVPEFIDQHERTIVVEQNRDGQLRSLLSIETGTPIDRLGSVRLYGGLPLTAPEVVDGILSQIGG